MRELCLPHTLLPLPSSYLYLCTLFTCVSFHQTNVSLSSLKITRERERERVVYSQTIHTRVDEPRAGAQRERQFLYQRKPEHLCN